MQVDYPTETVPATPEYFLELFRLDENAADLTMDDPLRYLLTHIDEFTFQSSKRMFDFLNQVFPGCLDRTDWNAHFPSLRGHTVGELCTYLAERVPRPVIRPWHGAGYACMPAGAFLTVRSLLAKRGANVEEIKPSTALEPYLRKHGEALHSDLCRLSPDLPFIHKDRRLLKPACWSFAGALCLTLLSWFISALSIKSAILVGSNCLLWMVALVLLMFANVLPPRRVTLGTMITFRDLAYALAGQPAPWRIKPAS